MVTSESVSSEGELALASRASARCSWSRVAAAVRTSGVWARSSAAWAGRKRRGVSGGSGVEGGFGGFTYLGGRGGWCWDLWGAVR